MKCPNCFADIRYSERRNNQCPKCFGSYVFEPKTHPLGLTDDYFSRTVDKISDNGKIYFTPEQLYFALTRKQNRKNDLDGFLLVVAIITIALAVCNGLIAVALIVGLFWAIFFTYRKFYAGKVIKLPQTFSDFDESVLQPWKMAHKKLPPHLITKKTDSEEFKKKLHGFLICDSNDAATFLNANKMDEKFNLFITKDFQNPRINSRTDLPIFVLHDAGARGYEFAEQIKKLYENDREVFDIGLRPNDVKVFELPIFRAKFPNQVNTPELTIEENKWLDKGFYTPLYVLKPSHLIEYVSGKIERRLAKTESV